MNDLTKYYKILHKIYSESIKDSKIFILSNTSDIISTHPLIDTFINRKDLVYSKKYKDVQKSLRNRIRDFLYKNQINFDILIYEIKSSNLKLVNYKNDIIYTELDEQNIINKKIENIINNYIKNNLLIISYLIDLKILFKISFNEFKEEIFNIKKKIHDLI